MQLENPSIRRHPWYREGEVLVLAMLVFATYFVRIDWLTIRGEESRWATVAREMLASGDYIVPRQFGEPFLSRPPLHPWLIAAVAKVRGQVDVIAIRLPTVTAVLLTTLLVYAFGRAFLGRLGAFTAAAAFATMPEVLQLGRVAESDSVFTCLLTHAVLLWYWGYSSGWPRAVTWSVAYAFIALACLTKGPQPPVNFGVTVLLFLAWRRDWRMLLGPGHLIGLAVFASIILGWQIPFYKACGFDDSVRIWGSDSTARFKNWTTLSFARHFLVYPLEVIGCTMPWSLLAVPFFNRAFRERVRSAQPMLVYFSIYFIISILPCWLSPGGMTRYIYALYPIVALVAGFSVEALIAMQPQDWLRGAWNTGWRVFATVMIATVLVAVFVAVRGVSLSGVLWKPTIATVVMVTSGVIAALGLIWSGRGTWQKRRVRMAIGGLAGFISLAYVGLVLDGMRARAGDSEAAVRRLQSDLPPDARLVGIDGTHHLFAYYYQGPIEARSAERILAGDFKDIRYFCYEAMRDERRHLPFAWEEVAVLSMDRHRLPSPINVVVVGRRIESAGNAGGE